MTIRPQIADAPGGIFFLDDWPDDEAEIKGVPLVGSDGHLLNRALRAANLTSPGQPPADYEPGLLPEARRLLWERRAHSFATVLGWQPSRETQVFLSSSSKRVEAWFEEPDGNAGPLILQDVWSTIYAAAPNVVVPLGPLALWTLTGYTSLDDWRGAPMEGTRGWQGKVFPTYPPRRIMQNYSLMGPLIADLMKVSREAAYPEIRPFEVALWLEPGLGDLQRFRREHVDTADLLTLDIETSVGQITSVQIGTSPSTAIVVPFVDFRNPNRSYWATLSDELAAWEWVRAVFDTPIPKLGQNFTAYDAMWLLDKYGIAVRNFRHDTRLMHHLLQPELPKSLAFMAALYSELPRWKSEVHHGAQTSARDKRDA